MTLLCSHNFLTLTIFVTLPILVFAENPHLKDELYKNYEVKDIKYLVHKLQPTFAPCKYGVQYAFDQPHFVSDPVGAFTIKRQCCDKCETLHTTLSNGAGATMCCMPNTPSRHGTGAHSFGGKDDKNLKVYLNHPLSIVFDSIVPQEMAASEYRTWANEGISEPRVGTGAWAYAFIGAAAAQTIVFILVVVFYYVSAQRIVLETVADCDYEIEQEVKVFNPSKSAMMSENMNSDLMSVSQAAV